jgi:hypothetical protein
MTHSLRIPGPELLEGALSRAAHDCDLLVTSGGMSVGSGDHIRSAIGRHGAEIWPLAIKPGKPVGFGDIDVPGACTAGQSHCTVVAIGRPRNGAASSVFCRTDERSGSPQADTDLLHGSQPIRRKLPLQTNADRAIARLVGE